MTYEEAVKLSLTPEQMAAAGVVVPTATVSTGKQIYIATKAYDTVFTLEDIDAPFEITGQRLKDGSRKTPQGKLVTLESADAKTPNLRIFCDIKIAGVNSSFMQEISKMNGCGFDQCVDQAAAAEGILLVKTGARITSINGVVSYHM